MYYNMPPKCKHPPKYSGKVKKRTHGVLSFWQQRELTIDCENLCCSKVEKKNNHTYYVNS